MRNPRNQPLRVSVDYENGESITLEGAALDQYLDECRTIHKIVSLIGAQSAAREDKDTNSIDINDLRQKKD